MDFSKGNIIEAHSPEFEFYQNKKPTGHYMRGIIKEVNKNTCVITSLSNGNDYEVDRNILVTLQQ